MRFRRACLGAGLAVLTLLATSCTPPRATDFDFNGDGRADFVWIDGAGAWRQGSATDNVVIGHMDPTAYFVPGDYDGDGRTEVASVAFGPSGNDWVTTGSAGTISFPRPPAVGTPDRSGNQIIPVPGRYAGGIRDLPAWYRDADGTWFIQGMDPIQFGHGPTTPADSNTVDAVDQDLPAPADYDGDGTTDLAVYNPRTGSYRIRSSIDASVSDHTLLATSTDPFILPVPGDYDHVGHAQAAVWGSRTGWVIDGRSTIDPFGSDPAVAYGEFNFPVPADYDGDDTTDLAMIRSDGRWQVEHDWNLVTIGDTGHGFNLPIQLTATRVWSIARFTLVGRCNVDSSSC